MEILSSPRAASPAISPPVSRGPHCLSADLSSFPGTGSLRSDPWGGRNFLGVLRQPEPAGPLAHLGPAAGSSAAPAAADAAVPTSSSAGDTVHASLASAPRALPPHPHQAPAPCRPALPLAQQGGRWPVLTFALWFWNQTWTTRTLRPVSAASVSRTCPEKGGRVRPGGGQAPGGGRSRGLGGEVQGRPGPCRSLERQRVWGCQPPPHPGRPSPSGRAWRRPQRRP